MTKIFAVGSLAFLLMAGTALAAAGTDHEGAAGTFKALRGVSASTQMSDAELQKVEGSGAIRDTQTYDCGTGCSYKQSIVSTPSGNISYSEVYKTPEGTQRTHYITRYN